MWQSQSRWHSIHIIVWCSLLASLVLWAAAACAQTSSTNDGRARAVEVVRQYDALGDKRSGSDADLKAAEWLAQRARAVGAQVALDSFSFTRTVPTDCVLAIGDERFMGLPKFDAGLTGPNGIEGTLGPLGSDADFGLLVAGPNAEYDRKFVSAASESKHRAVVAVTKGGVPGLALINASLSTETPILLVSSEDGESIARYASKRSRCKLVVRADRCEALSHNVVARVEGLDPRPASVVVMTPRSGWWHCAGERGGGIVCWLEALDAVVKARPKRNVVFLASGGHELGHLGLKQFEAENPTLASDAHVWVHFGANIGARGSDVGLQPSGAEIGSLARDALERTGVKIARVVSPGTPPWGEARDVFLAGGRYLSLNGTPGATFHHPADRWPTAVEPERIAQLAQAFTQIVVELAQQ